MHILWELSGIDPATLHICQRFCSTLCMCYCMSSGCRQEEATSRPTDETGKQGGDLELSMYWWRNEFQQAHRVAKYAFKHNSEDKMR